MLRNNHAMCVKMNEAPPQGELLFSMSDYGLLDVVPWQMYLIFYAIAALLFFPAIARQWPIRNFAFFQKNHRLSALVLASFVSVHAAVVLLMSAPELSADKLALKSGDYESIVGCYIEPGATESIDFPARQFAAMEIDISGRKLGLPLGGTGLFFIDHVRAALPEGEPILVFIRENALIEARRLDVTDGEALACA